MALTLLCLANLMGVFDGKPDCLNDPIFTLKGTSIDCAAGP
jgi:hypothetical protein